MACGFQASGNGVFREDIGPLAVSDDNGSNQMICHCLRADGFDASEDGTGRGTPLTICIDLQNAAANGNLAGTLQGEALKKQTYGMAVAFDSKQSAGDTGQLSPPLQALNHDKSHANAGGQVAVAFQTRIGRNGRGQCEEVCPTLQGADAGATSDMRPCVSRGMAVRRLTPRECERLQGYPDNYTAVEFKGKPAADGPRYRALGNSMAVPVMRWLGERILESHSPATTATWQRPVEVPATGGEKG